MTDDPYALTTGNLRRRSRAVYLACEEPVAKDISKSLQWAAAEIDLLRKAIADIKQATIDGRVCDDVAWFDTVTTLHDFCDLVLTPAKSEPVEKSSEGQS